LAALRTNFFLVDVDDSMVDVGTIAPYDEDRHRALEEAHGDQYVFRWRGNALEVVRAAANAASLGMDFKQRSPVTETSKTVKYDEHEAAVIESAVSAFKRVRSDMASGDQGHRDRPDSEIQPITATRSISASRGLPREAGGDQLDAASPTTSVRDNEKRQEIQMPLMIMSSARTISVRRAARFVTRGPSALAGMAASSEPSAMRRWPSTSTSK
jgi:hypothetical protein